MTTAQAQCSPRPIELVPVTVLCRFDPTGEILSVPLMGELVAPGLAITPAVHDGTFQGGWTFTHLPSGHCVVPRAMCLNCCRSMASSLATFGAWNRDADGVTGDDRAKPLISALVKAVVDCDGYRCGTPWTPAGHVDTLREEY
jgi:hypothetical protein